MKRRPGSMATYTSLCIYRITKLSSSRVALRMEARLRNAKDQRRSGYGDAASSRHEGAAARARIEKAGRKYRKARRDSFFAIFSRLRLRYTSKRYKPIVQR
ncbi:hypothetical protein IF1G_11440 [Cordyceps javanica]|uniref:Uncharacterized protein n=1 Tax=Cordyceps javanica TaxID=43265 RepID=A0A545UK98_9HYPO|nr:hypothetical protein IF1G_11440 [Cordyceps javanica]